MPRIVLDDPGTGAITFTDGSVRSEPGRVVAVDGSAVTSLSDEFLAAAERRARESDDLYQEEAFLSFGPDDVIILVAEVRRLAAEVRRLTEAAETARGEKP